MDDLLTTRQLQDLLQVDRITIYRMLHDGRLRGFKVGGQWRFSRTAIRSWIDHRTRAGPVGDTGVPSSVDPGHSATRATAKTNRRRPR